MRFNNITNIYRETYLLYAGIHNMNVHFFVTFSKDANDSIFARELAKQDFKYTIFSEKISLAYKRRIWLYLVGWPRMILFSFRQAFKSINTNPYPEWVVVGSHFEALAIILITRFFLKKKPKIMLLGFIYTSKYSYIINKLKYFYFSKLLEDIDCVICHSVFEVKKNEKLFRFTKHIFKFIPYGLHLALTDECLEGKEGELYAVSAGRSGRDYDLLIQCFVELGYQLHIICDSKSTITDKEYPENIKILRSCYGSDYINELVCSNIVIIPIAVDDLSAGQMVLLQSMALKKAIIITRTRTTSDYIKDMHDGILVDIYSKDKMKDAIKELWNNEDLKHKLSTNAFESYKNKYSMASYIEGISNLLKEVE